MRRGCISSGEIKCDICHRTIPYSERYLAVTEEKDAEAGQGKLTRYCVDCALKKGYATYKKEEKGPKILTFLS